MLKQIPQQLSDSPLTIRDAIQVVKNIGHRYLWVDRYCLPQVDTFKRREEIQNMNQIYAGPEVTIVAMFGNNDCAGLPGVSSISRPGLQQVPIQGGQMVSTLPPLATVISQSVWSTRGWTYQEARLSSRVLFFTEYQVYFSCHRVTLTEALPDGSSTSSAARHLNSKGLDPGTFSALENNIPGGLFLDRLMYSQKTLSYQCDALHEFRGILRQQNFVTLWGVPVTCRGWRLDPCVGFAMGLLWVRRPWWSVNPHVINHVGDSYTRRPGFPTWSWTSVVGEIFQDNYGKQSFYGKLIHGVSDIPSFPREEIVSSFQVKLSDSGISLAEAIELTRTNILPETSTSVFLEGEIIRVRKCTKADDSFWFCKADGDPIDDDFDHRINAEMDTDGTDHPPESREQKFGPQDALILIEWSDDQPPSETRFVLMLLRWRGDGTAERAGLLGEYRKKWEKRFVTSLPRERRCFELQ